MDETKINQAEPKRHVFTRDELVQALRTEPVPGTLMMLSLEGGGPEDLADAIIAALDGAAS